MSTVALDTFKFSDLPPSIRMLVNSVTLSPDVVKVFVSIVFIMQDVPARSDAGGAAAASTTAAALPPPSPPCAIMRRLC